MTNPPAVLEAAVLAARQVGILARRLQGQVRDEGKQVDLTDTKGDAYLTRQKEAKTAVDEIAQDLIITALLPHLDVANTVLDGEEETPGKALLPATAGEYALVLDPIDGTLIYLEGGNTYAVNIGLFKNGGIVLALLYYPALDVCYYTTGAGVFRARDFALHGLAKQQEVFFAAEPDRPRSVFLYYAIAEELEGALRAAGYEIVRAPNRGLSAYADPVDALLQGGVRAALIGNMQVRDLMHGAMLTCTRGGSVQQWNGAPYIWPQQGGALPRIVVSGWPLPDDLKDILARAAAQYAA